MDDVRFFRLPAARGVGAWWAALIFTTDRRFGLWRTHTDASVLDGVQEITQREFCNEARTLRMPDSFGPFRITTVGVRKFYAH